MPRGADAALAIPGLGALLLGLLDTVLPIEEACERIDGIAVAAIDERFSRRIRKR